MKRLYAMSLALGMAVGSAVGIWCGQVFVKAVRTLSEMSATSAAANFAFLQYKYADLQHARQALIFGAQFLDDVDAIHTDRASKIDAALSYGRLALLEESAGNRKQSQAYFAKAQERLKAASKSKSDCSEAKVREILQKRDRF